MKSIRPLLVLAVAVLALLIDVSGKDPNIWPLPLSATYGDAVLTLASPFTFTAVPVSFPPLDRAIARFRSVIFTHRTPNTTVSDSGNDRRHRRQWSAEPSMLRSLAITVLSTNHTLDLDTDESYNLTIPTDTDTAALISATLYGALHGLETFTQLVAFNFDASVYQIAHSPWTISDRPRFPHRGLMLDTSRHFLPLSYIQKVIESMAMNKLNVLHWHLTDDQSFPYQSLLYPSLAQAAYGTSEIYSYSDIQSIVQYGLDRGVRLVLEIDTPGHARSWCRAFPSICPNVTCQSPLDPSNELTFTIIEQLWRELTSIAPSSIIHIGTDEVDATCWNQTAHIRQWMTDNNLTLHSALKYFTDRVTNITRGLGRTAVCWDECYDEFRTALQPNTIVQIWRLTQLHINATMDGYRTILSVEIPLYLNGDSPWQTIYATDPWDGIDDSHQRSLVLGGEACEWGEQTDASDLMPTIWPRAAAAAEKLWSAWEVNDILAAHPRLGWFRCYMNRRGIEAAPLNNPHFRSPPLAAGACMDQ